MKIKDNIVDQDQDWKNGMWITLWSVVKKTIQEYLRNSKQYRGGVVYFEGFCIESRFTTPKFFIKFSILTKL